MRCTCHRQQLFFLDGVNITFDVKDVRENQDGSVTLEKWLDDDNWEVVHGHLVYVTIPVCQHKPPEWLGAHVEEFKV